ncbi:MAG: hypothetical protein J7M05_10335 [Anaerolineae bacterium]|nr:hypothetical protein [Anaerolineae bacterium]
MLILALCLWLGGHITTIAQTPWTIFTSRDGLLRSAVRCLEPGSGTELFIGTAGGLDRWDGSHFISYTTLAGLPQGEISAICQANGRLWAGSWGGGLGCLRGDKWHAYSSRNSPLPGDWISDLASQGDTLWIATYGDGLARLRGNTWQTFTRASSALPSDWLTCLLPDEHGGLWIGTERAGLVYFFPRRSRWERYSLPQPGVTKVTALALQGARLWVGTPQGVAILHLPTGTWQVLTRGEGLPGDDVTALASNSAQEMWIVTTQGLARWRQGELTTFGSLEGFPSPIITALTFDSQGRLWVGTPKGLLAKGEVDRPQVERLPIVLVHGWRGPESDRLEDSEFWFLARWLAQDGFQAYYVTGISPKNTLQENAARLQQEISLACQQAGSKQAYLLAFSMGGLNARAYLESTLYQGKVRRAFILGTPHRGEHLWLPLLLWETLYWTEEPSAQELWPLHAELFNQGHLAPGDPPYTLIAGDARKSDLPTLFQQLPPSDGLVSTWSALGPESMQAERYLCQDVHAWGKETILLDIPTLLLPRTTYDAFIRPYLFGDKPTASPLQNRVLPPQEMPHTIFRGGQISPGETLSLGPFAIEEGKRVHFYLRWHGPPLEMHLQTPSGETITPKKTEKRDDSEYLELGFADFASYVLTDTLAGPWQIIVSSSDEHSKASDYVAYASISSTLRLTLKTTSNWYPPGSPLVLTATLSTPLKEAFLTHVDATFFPPSRKPVTFTLRPIAKEGQNSLSYQGKLNLPQESGYGVLFVRALGEIKGKHFERQAEKIIGIKGNWAHLEAPYLLAGPSAKEIHLGADIVAERAGACLCTFTLVNPSGREWSIAHPCHLSPGLQRIRFTWPRPRGFTGRLSLKRILLQDVQKAAILLDQIDLSRGDKP